MVLNVGISRPSFVTCWHAKEKLTRATTVKYPVHLSFDHWRLPHDDLPYPWSNLDIPQIESSSLVKQKVAAAIRDGGCRLSGHRDATKVAHIVPLSAGQWYTSNAMDRCVSSMRVHAVCASELADMMAFRYIRYPDELDSLDDEQNLLLRKGLHCLFDQRCFALTVKMTTSDDGHNDTNTAYRLTSHVLLPRGRQRVYFQSNDIRASRSTSGRDVRRFASQCISTRGVGNRYYCLTATREDEHKHSTACGTVREDRRSTKQDFSRWRRPRRQIDILQRIPSSSNTPRKPTVAHGHPLRVKC